jgi:plastocyanin
MTWRSATSSKTVGAALLLALPLFSATVSGRVILIDSHDPGVKKRDDFAGVAVWLKPLDGVSYPLSRKHAEMLQKNKAFHPHVLVVQAGTTVDFPNADPIFHNAFSNFEGQIFDIGLYPPGTSQSIQFAKTGIVRVFCNIHPTMSAVIVVVDSPFFALTDQRGSYLLRDVQPGRYELHLFHDRATPETLGSLVRTIVVDDAPVQLTQATISEAGYLPVAHKNKYGRDYPRTADEPGLYTNPGK